LIEDDLLILENGRPAETFAIEAARAGEIGDAESDDGKLLLHDPRTLICADATCAGGRVAGLGAHAPARTPARGAAGLTEPACLFRPAKNSREKVPVQKISSGGRTGARCRRVSVPHRSGGRDCTGRSEASLPSRAKARSSP